MTHRRRPASLRATLACERGNISIFTALTIPALLIVVGAAGDINRVQGMKEMMQTTADVAAREAVRGGSDAQVAAYVHGTLTPYLAKMGYADPGSSALVSIERNGETAATVQVSALYTSPFTPLYIAAGQSPMIVAAATQRSFCAATGTRWTPTTQACPGGQTGMISFDQEEAQHCPSATSQPAWGATANQQNYMNTCSTP